MNHQQPLEEGAIGQGDQERRLGKVSCLPESPLTGVLHEFPV